MIAFPRLWPLTLVCVVYVVKEVTSFRGLGQLMGVVHKERALKLYRPAEKNARKKAV